MRMRSGTRHRSPTCEATTMLNCNTRPAAAAAVPHQQRLAAAVCSSCRAHATWHLQLHQQQQQWRRRRCHAASAAGAGGQQQEAAAAALAAWMERHAGPLPARLQPVVCDASGRHRMLAGEALQPGQLLLQVPQALLLTASSAAASKLCGKLVTSAQLSEWQALVLQLLCERAAGAGSFWAPWVAVLGDQSHHPLLWGAELQGQLAGSPMLRLLQERLQQVAEDAEVLAAAGANELAVAQQWQQQTQEPLVTPSSVAWAAAVLLGRSFALDMAEPDLSLEGDLSSYGTWTQHGPASLALVPWADMLCRRSSSSSGSSSSDAGGEGGVLVWDPDARAALLTADASYAPGAEVWAAQADGLSAADALMDQGWVAPGEQEAHARADAPLADHVAPRGPRNAALLGAVAALAGGSPSISLAPSGPDVTGLALLRAALASDAELLRAGWRAGSGAGDLDLCARVMGRLSVPASSATEAALLGALARLVAACTACYPTSLQQDQEELARLEQQQQQQQQEAARASVLRALVAEKAALAGCGRVVAHWQQQLNVLLAAPGGTKPQQLAELYAGSDGDDNDAT